MKDLDIHDPDQAKNIQEILKQGAQGEFWKILTQRLQEAIDGLQGQLESDMSGFVADEYKIRTEVIKKQLQDRKEIMTLPQDLANELDNPEFFVQDREEEVYEEPKSE